MTKRKATFTKQHAADNRAMIRRAKVLLADADLDTVANDHPEVVAALKVDFPGVTDVRIVHRVAQALHQLRDEKIISLNKIKGTIL